MPTYEESGDPLPPVDSHLIYTVTDYDEDIQWDRLCYPEVRMSSVPIAQCETAVSESSSSLVAETSPISAIYQENIQTYTCGTSLKDFSAPWLEAAENLSRDHPAWVSAAAPPTARVTNPAIDVRLMQVVLHILLSQASLCLANSRIGDMLKHVATLQWMCDYHRRSGGS